VSDASLWPSLQRPVRVEMASVTLQKCWIVAIAFVVGSPVLSAATEIEVIRHWNRVGRSADAERAARASLSEAERVHGSESAEVAEVLDELAVALRRGGKGAEPEALEVCQRALRIKERIFGVTDPRYATSLYNLGLLYLGLKDYAQARSMLEQTLKIRKQALGSNHPDVAKSLLGLSSVHHDLGNYAEGLALAEQAVAIEQGSLEPEDPERVNGLNMLAVARYSTGDFSGSIPLYEEAIGLWEHSSTPNKGAMATGYHNLGAVYDEIGDHHRAVEVLERALRLREDLYGANHPLVATTLSVLGDALEGMGDLSKAKACYKRAVQILEKTAPRDPVLGWVRSKLGWVYLEDQDMSRAAEALQRALRELEGSLGPDHPDAWISLRGLAMVARNRGKEAEARGYYERTVDLLRRTSGPNHPDLGRTLVEYASFQLATGDSLAALNTALTAAEVNREHLRLTVHGVAERQALLYTSSLKTGLDVALAALPGTGSARAEVVRRVWDAVIRSRALVLDEVAERARMVEGAGDVVDKAKQLESARSRLANLLVHGSSGEAPERSRALVARAREDVERAERELASRSASFRRGQDRAALGWDQIVSALPSGSALVSILGYGEGHARSFLALVLGRDRTPKTVALGSAEEIDRLIERWRKLAGKPPDGDARAQFASEAACRAAGQALRVRVWDPIANLLDGSRMVFMVPDGSLDLLNVVALPAPNTGYLIESPYVLHYLSAERDLVAPRDPPSPGTGLLALGGASFDLPEIPRSPASVLPMAASRSPARASDRAAYREAVTDCESFRSFRFEPLPETVNEVEEIRGFWRPEEVVTLEGQSAGERSVKELLPGRRVAHFATHGFFLDGHCGRSTEDGATTPRGMGGLSVAAAAHSTTRAVSNPFFLSGLALAGANRRTRLGPGEDDGILTADEIASLNLSGVDWVVLSACDTGVGQVLSGEGVLGLRRAFEVAGAGTLIMSLWPVEDRCARDWMRALYEGRFRRNLETAEAVREADLAVLKSLRVQGRCTHPFYWAAFVAAGGWR